MFAYNKNYQEIQNSKSFNVFSDRNSNSGGSDNIQYKTFTLDYIFKKLVDFGEDQAVNRIKKIANWKLKTTENILKSLLKNGLDVIAK